MKMRIISLLCFFVFWGMMAGCAQKTAEVKQNSIESREPVRVLSIEEQKKEAFVILNEILLLSNGPDREINRPEIKSLYREIIDRYPDLGLAQEGYMRLIILAKEENTPEGDAEAESLYREFLQQYPDSQLQRIIENELQGK